MKQHYSLSSQQRHHGFTLLELLVVVSIIALLAAILFPAFSRARENARRSSCQSNLKQIGLALMQYTQAYDEKIVGHYFKATTSATDGHPGAYRWMDAIYPYVKSPTIFDCPSDIHLDNYVYRDPSSPHNEGFYGSYGINNAYWGEPTILGAVSVLDQNKLLALSDLQAPSTTVWVTDTDRTLENNNFEIQWEDIQKAPTSVADTEPPSVADMTARHLGRVNVLYCDGHVKSMKLYSLLKTGQNGVLTYFTAAQDAD